MKGCSPFPGTAGSLYKRNKNRPLTTEQRPLNRELSRERIVIENMNAKIKTFKIMSDRYRCRRKRHFLRMNLIYVIINYETKLEFPNNSNRCTYRNFK
ncbi:MAG: transposase [Planctomycetaceae bacterium]|nr:transposase [Planctomycetaceae bacterium]